MLSECLTHDTIAVYEFQKIITHYLKKMIYFTDGAAQHFKNKYNFINLLHHKMNFTMNLTEWEELESQKFMYKTKKLGILNYVKMLKNWTIKYGLEEPEIITYKDLDSDQKLIKQQIK